MSLKLALLLALLAASAGIGFGYLLRLLISLGRKGSMELEIRELEARSREEATQILEEAETKAEEILKGAQNELRERETRLKAGEDRIIKKEETLDKRQSDIDREAERVEERAVEVRSLKDRIQKLAEEKTQELSKISNLSIAEAKDELMRIIERDFEEDFLVKMKKIETQNAERLDKRAKEILATAIQRLSSSIAGEVMATSVPLASDDIKGKIIGKEGRNIKAFERATGVEVIVDDTPNLITLSSFDPVRRAVARLALENLIADGRIQPAKIEEFVSKAQEEINKIIREKGEEAALECEVYNLDPKLLSILGRLHFRTSYSQNVLEHSVEMAHLAGMIAEELGANVSVAKAGALLHDIGKALDHEVAGTHVEIGRRILQKFGVSGEIIKAMQAHHGEYPYETIESVIVQTADAISGGRPGARRDNLENYLKRLEDLENIATSFEGVEKAYALEAGREIRVFVTPEKISDLEAKKIARDIAIRIESELKYPGEIKVNVIREARSIEFAR
ncbi:MAG: ribonuclease Y [Candidatus Zambryskibacteria bacterium RIFCSPLOWO2_02_FULL_51_21]|uniref:Ribonuclease Y n=1 Tax=Candidatus Zambryskibacteria bacterium RIFCSPHIGHO2_02_FULL_43_37 TaxID=1802749 RepID=A0A1G2TGF7_9BACT|nr:MAG: ribonuclease Y [Candidatus Zambryskibacteria bacterium RIFCSPHIGHO2_01_FULL_52_18]OHA96374.1 MAG: ribonuclease Y [Candidatus Zambryskibacteria bacterium RIFCSPHIGHO2_02_FULL_43_37]OHB07774.1 MAG: ribonuclease Y [Candidatus Zambryskibacteria bacterium RIFCSPLOWO2_01_FULL_52_12]OHB11366.1 MAG: ribonuclease Y [Candidatus Zambryskibacteria bacterium RIFCSPLOWO2_02_FULL_51_21]